MIKAQDQHLKDLETQGDAAHQSARDDMKNRWKHPVKGTGWYRDVKKTFASLPESQGPDSQGPESQGPESQGPESQGPES